MSLRSDDNQLLQTTPSPQLFGGPGPAPPTIGQATVAPSGKSIVLLAQDGTGASTNITSITSSSEVQSIQLVSTPAGNAFTLSFNGQKTAPLPTTTTPPATYLLWTFPTISGHAYSLAVNFYGDHGNLSIYSPVTLGYETMISGAVVSTLTRSGSPVGEFTDTGVNCPSGNPAFWEPVASGAITATASTMQLRCTGSLGVGYYMSAIRVEDTTANTITYYTVSESANVSFVGNSGAWYTDAQSNAYGGSEIVCGRASGIGPVTVIAPGSSSSAAVLQGALQGLSTIGLDGVIVTDSSGLGSGNYLITFAESLANSPQPLITCPDPAVSIAQVAAGGNCPTLSINGGEPMFLGNWIWTEPVGVPPLPCTLCPLPQSAPATQTFITNMLPYATTGFWDGTLADDASLSGTPVYGWSSGVTMSFTIPELPPGTYQFAITYPNASFVKNSTTYQPSTATQFLVQDVSGNTLATYSVDQTQALSDYQSEGHGWKILGSTTLETRGTLSLVMTTVGQSAAASGAPQIVAILDAIQLNRTSADTSVVIGPSDVATLDIPAGWMTTQAGAVPAISGLSVSPPSPTAIMPPFVANQKTMKVGYNVEYVSFYNTMVTHSNLAYLIPTMGSVQDANGYPTRFMSPYYAPGTYNQPVILASAVSYWGDPPQGTYIINPGLFVMTWDGDSTTTLTASGNATTVVEVTESQILTGTTGNRRVFDIQFDATQVARPCFTLSLHSTTPDLVLDPTGNTYITNLSNLKIYPPDPSDPTGNTIWANPPKFHPWFLYKLQGMQCLRFLDPLNSNANPASSLAQYKPETHANRCNPTVTNKTVAVAQIQQAPAGNLYFVDYNGPVLQVTTTTPHGLYDGCQVNFSGCGTAAFQDGKSAVLDSNTTGVYTLVHVLDATNLICAVIFSGADTAPMTNVLTGGSLIAPNYGTFWSLQDITDLVAAVPTVTELHFNVSATIDVTPGGGAEQVAAFLAANLSAGIKVHVEYGNECWNYAFNTNIWCALQNARITGTYSNSYEIFYANQAKAVHDQFLTAFTAAGRATDVVHLYGVFTGQPGNTVNILTQATANGATVDEVCVAVYFSAWPAISAYASDQLPIFDAMPADQLLDYMELTAVYGQYPENLVANQFPALTEGGYPEAKVIAYEGSVDTLVPIDPINTGGPANTPNFVIRQQTARNHPRMYGVLLQMAQSYQDAGLTMWSYFHIGGSGSIHCWDSYVSGNQQRGTGTDADTINLTSPLEKNLVLNEEGGAWHYWSTLSAPAGTTTTKKAPGRNGKIRAIGLPHGMFRTTRSR
jgi:hypothetical protein